MKTNMHWQQRFLNYKNAFGQLERFISKNEFSYMEKLGLIKSFENTYEIAWSTLADYLEHQGFINVSGPLDTIIKALRINLINNKETWMSMWLNRTLTQNSYDENIANEISSSIIKAYFPIFKEFENKFERLASVSHPF